MSLTQGERKISFTQFTSSSVMPPRATGADLSRRCLRPGIWVPWNSVAVSHEMKHHSLHSLWIHHENHIVRMLMIFLEKKSQLNFTLCLWFPKVLSLRVITWKLNCRWNRRKVSAHYRHFCVCTLACVCACVHARYCWQMARDEKNSWWVKPQDQAG